MRKIDQLGRPAVATASYDDSEDGSDIDLAALSEEDFESDTSQEEEVSFAQKSKNQTSVASSHPRLKNTADHDAVRPVHREQGTPAAGGPPALKRKREHKHAPMQMSSKKPVSRAREAVEVVKIDRRDPRFDQQASAAPTPELAASRHKYKFLLDYRTDEMAMLRDSMKKEKDPVAKAKLEKSLSSMQSQLQAAQERDRRTKVVSKHNAQQREAAKSGKQPFYLKETEKQALYLKDKFEGMKDSKALNTYLQKKRKRRSQKDRRQLG